MFYFSAGGLILDYSISSYKGIAVFQLVINGVGGNLVAVQASRISTSLYKQQKSGLREVPVISLNPFRVFFASGSLNVHRKKSKNIFKNKATYNNKCHF